MKAWGGVILAAGRGLRMRSRTPKVLHLLAGRPLIAYALEAVEEALGARPLIVRDSSPRLPEALGEGWKSVVQAQPNGTGGALFPLRPLMEGQVEHLLIVNGDNPFLSAASLQRLMRAHLDNGATLTLLSWTAPLVEDLGRIVRNAAGEVSGVVEAAEEAATRRGSAEANCGAYCLEAAWLWTQLPLLPRHGNGEYLLTDLVGMASRGGRAVLAVPASEPWEAVGINTRVHLARAEAEMRHRVLERLMLGGVTVVDPATTYVDATVSVGQDTVLLPHTILQGATAIGEECRIGPGAQISHSRIGARCVINASVLEDATLEEEVTVGPFSHLRPETYLSRGVHIGNYAEVKASRLGRNVAMGHFSYVGDAEIGDNVNIGAGVITCNFDGVDKHRTIVEGDVFLGSDTMLVAPVRVGARSATAAGAVVNRDVPPDTLAVGVPARFRPKKTTARTRGGSDLPRDA